VGINAKNRTRTLLPVLLPALLLLAVWCRPSIGQAYDWGLVSGNRLGPRFETEYVEPAVHRWYGLRHLPETYVHPWYRSATGYARQPYERYVNSLLEGDEIYDSFGSRLGRGWLVYDWRQRQAQPRGSLINKDRDSRSIGQLGNFSNGAYDNFFNRLVIAGDRGRYGTYRLVVGDEIYTRFTPLTFFKPRFNGVRFDYAGDYASGTVLLSRPSNPNFSERSDATHVFGGHTEFRVGPRATFGLTYVNAHNTRTENELIDESPLRGVLTTQSNQSLDKLWVRVRDDSPGNGSEGAVLADFDIVLTDTSGRKLRGKEIGFLPKLEGGRNEGGRLIALDSEDILLEYDLEDFEFEGIRTSEIVDVGVELSVSNDYRIELASDLQTDGERFNPEIVFTTVRRAAGNVQDNSNTGFVAVDYGLPTANELIGTDWNLVDWHGFSAQGELVLNRRFFRFPNPDRPRQVQHSQSAMAAYTQVAYDAHPFKAYFEGFRIEDDYSTSYWVTDDEGRIRFKDPVPQVYEFVDDDDDFNGLPEWERPFLDEGGIHWNEVALPGLDEDADFLNDFNQNRNEFPDYTEPFLRYRSERPEFLFGLDMNHNGTIDRFENDLLPDYPYKRDHRGFNSYIRISAGPAAYLSLGRQDMRLISGDGRTESWYGLANLVWRPRRGQVRLAAWGARVHDNITDDLRQWFQPVGSLGRMRDVIDRLPQHDAWNHSLYADWDQNLGHGARMQHRVKWDWTRQFDSRNELRRRQGRRTADFLGVVNKAEWSIALGLGTLEPRVKSEYRRDSPFSTVLQPATSLEETFFLLWTQPLFAEHGGVTYFPRYGRQIFNTELQVGAEATWLWLLKGQRDEAEEDFFGLTLVGQLSNRVAYQGYNLVTRMGIRFTKQRFESSPSESASLFFLSINAGLRN
jgi:hypothetical protein